MEDKYYLAIETKPNNYFPINLPDLNISNGFTSTKITEIDSFTLKFNENEILNSVKEANLIDLTSTMNLVIIYNEKNVIRKAPVLTKDKSYNMWNYIKENYTNKNFLNKIYNFLNNKVEPDFLNSLKSSPNVLEFLNQLSLIPYNIERKLYFYLHEK